MNVLFIFYCGQKDFDKASGAGRNWNCYPIPPPLT